MSQPVEKPKRIIRTPEQRAIEAEQKAARAAGRAQVRKDRVIELARAKSARKKALRSREVAKNRDARVKEREAARRVQEAEKTRVQKAEQRAARAAERALLSEERRIQREVHDQKRMAEIERIQQIEDAYSGVAQSVFEKGPVLDDDLCSLDKHGRPSPNFAVQETATAFLGHSPDWLRWRYRPDTPATGDPQFPNGYFVLDGEILIPSMTPSGSRYYTLADIEKMTFALFQNSVVGSPAFICILNTVYSSAYLYEIIEEPIIHGHS